MTRDEKIKELEELIARKFLEYDFDRHGVRYGLLATDPTVSLEQRRNGDVVTLLPVMSIAVCFNQTQII